MWGDCGLDSCGRPIGYAYEATCDYEGCHNDIDRGLFYACGEEHGSDEIFCEKYFCKDHHVFNEIAGLYLCLDCASNAKAGLQGKYKILISFIKELATKGEVSAEDARAVLTTVGESPR